MRLIAILVGFWLLALLVALTLGRPWFGLSLSEAIIVANLIGAAFNLGVAEWYKR